MEHFEKTLSSDLLYEGRIINLRRDAVMLENGKTSVREVVEHNGGVAVLALDSEDKIYFVSQFRYPFKDVLLELPAGKLEKGEDPAQAGLRELGEECGCLADRFIPLGKLYPTCAYCTEIIYLYLAMDLRPTCQNLDDNEFLTVSRIPVDTAVQMVLDGKIPDAKSQLAILKFQALRSAGRI